MTKAEVFQHEKNLRDYAAGDTIFEEGSEGDVMYAVIKGEVELLSQGSQVDTLSGGDIFGEMALIDHTTRSATAKAKTAVTLAIIDKRRFLWLVQETPMVALQVMSVMAERIRRLTRKTTGA